MSPYALHTCTHTQRILVHRIFCWVHQQNLKILSQMSLAHKWVKIDSPYTHKWVEILILCRKVFVLSPWTKFRRCCISTHLWAQGVLTHVFNWWVSTRFTLVDRLNESPLRLRPLCESVHVCVCACVCAHVWKTFWLTYSINQSICLLLLLTDSAKVLCAYILQDILLTLT